MGAKAERTIEIPHEQLLQEQDGFTTLPGVTVHAQQDGTFLVTLHHQSENTKPETVIYQNTFSIGPEDVGGKVTIFEFQIPEAPKLHEPKKILGYYRREYVCV